MAHVVTCLDANVFSNCPIHKCVDELSIALIQILFAFSSYILVSFILIEIQVSDVEMNSS